MKVQVLIGWYWAVICIRFFLESHFYFFIHTCNWISHIGVRDLLFKGDLTKNGSNTRFQVTNMNQLLLIIFCFLLLCCPEPIVECSKGFPPGNIILTGPQIFTKEMIFPVPLSERDKDCGRTLHNNTNAYHDGADHIHTYKREDINKVHSLQAGCPVELKCEPLSVCARVFEIYCQLDKKNMTLINQKWNSYIMCLTTQSTVLFLHCLWNGSIHLPDERENAEDNRTFLHRPIFTRPPVCRSLNQYLLNVCVLVCVCACVWARCSHAGP